MTNPLTRRWKEWRVGRPERYYRRRLRFWLPAGAEKYAANRTEYLNDSISRIIALKETRKKFSMPDWTPRH